MNNNLLHLDPQVTFTCRACNNVINIVLNLGVIRGENYGRRVSNGQLRYLGLMISRCRHHPAQNLHRLRQLRCKLILALMSLLLLPLWSGYRGGPLALQFTRVVRLMAISSTHIIELPTLSFQVRQGLEIHGCEEEGRYEETKGESETWTVQFNQR